MRRQMFPQRLDAIALGGMVAGSDEGHAGLPRQMDGVFGNLAGEEGIHSQIDGQREVILSSAAAPGDTADLTLRFADDQRLAVQYLLYILTQ